MRRIVPLIVLLGCGSPEPVAVSSYNAGLAKSFVRGAEERTGPTAGATGGIEADVVCLQEVWAPEAVDAVKAASAGSFPDNYFMDPQPPPMDGAVSCEDGAIDALITCANTQCAGLCSDDLVDCVFAQCPGDFLTLPKRCQECVMAEVGDEPDAIQATCEANPPDYAYDNSFGIGLLSRYPITSTEETVFESTTNRRGLIHAVLDGPNGAIDAYCTHLSAVFSSIPYPKDEGSWIEEQAAQIDEMIGIVQADSTADTVYVIGDMNTGPAVGEVAAEVPGNYQKFVDAGWADPYAEQADPPCTFCGSNPLVGSDDRGDDVIIDHVFRVSAFEGTASSARILDAEIETESCGEPITAAYSDHYGITVTFTPE